MNGVTRSCHVANDGSSQSPFASSFTKSDGRSLAGRGLMWRSGAQKHRAQLNRGWFYRGIRCLADPPGLSSQNENTSEVDMCSAMGLQTLTSQPELGRLFADSCSAQNVQIQGSDEDDSAEDISIFSRTVQ